METNKLKKTAERFSNVAIIALVVVGMFAFVLVNHASDGGELMSKLFLAFLGAIITVQIIPGLILLGAMLKGVTKLGHKQEAAVEVSGDAANKH